MCKFKNNNHVNDERVDFQSVSQIVSYKNTNRAYYSYYKQVYNIKFLAILMIYFKILINFNCFAAFAQKAPNTNTKKSKQNANIINKAQSEADKNRTQSSYSLPSVNELERNNQMILLAVERIKTGNYKDAKEVALQMVKLAEKYSDTSSSVSGNASKQKAENKVTSYKSFANKLEEKIYLELISREHRQKHNIVPVLDPISDGYYLLSIIDFQEGNIKSALENINKAIEWNPVRAAYYLERAFLSINDKENKDLAAALANYAKALELSYSPADFAASLRGLGFTFIEENNLELALSCYLLSQQYEPENEAAKKQIAFIRSLNPNLVSRYDLKRAIETLSKYKILTKYNSIIFDALIELIKDLEKNKSTSKEEILKWLDFAKLLDPNNEKIIKEINRIKNISSTK